MYLEELVSLEPAGLLAWFTDARNCRSANRCPEEVWYGRINDLGFRVGVDVPAERAPDPTRAAPVA